MLQDDCRFFAYNESTISIVYIWPKVGVTTSLSNINIVILGVGKNMQAYVCVCYQIQSTHSLICLCIVKTLYY